MPGAISDIIMKRLFRWAFYGMILMLVCIVAGVLLLDTAAKAMLEGKIRADSGMDVKIGKLTIGLLSPTLRIEEFTLYNTAEFGGSPLIKMPELFVEYDLPLLKKQQVHLKLLRVNLEQVSIIQDKRARYNVGALQPKKMAGANKRFEFTGIDTLNLTIQTVRFGSLESPGQDRQVDFNIKNQQFHNLKSEKDIQAVALALAAKGGSSLFNLILPLSKAAESPRP